MQGVSTLGMRLYDRGKKLRDYASQFYEENLEDKVQELRENFYKKQDQLFQMLEAAIVPLANQGGSVDGMPKNKIRQL